MGHLNGLLKPPGMSVIMTEEYLGVSIVYWPNLKKKRSHARELGESPGKIGTKRKG